MTTNEPTYYNYVGLSTEYDVQYYHPVHYTPVYCVDYPEETVRLAIHPI